MGRGGGRCQGLGLAWKTLSHKISGGPGRGCSVLRHREGGAAAGAMAQPRSQDSWVCFLVLMLSHSSLGQTAASICLPPPCAGRKGPSPCAGRKGPSPCAGSGSPCLWGLRELPKQKELQVQGPRAVRPVLAQGSTQPCWGTARPRGSVRGCFMARRCSGLQAGLPTSPHSRSRGAPWSRLDRRKDPRPSAVPRHSCLAAARQAWPQLRQGISVSQ